MDKLPPKRDEDNPSDSRKARAFEILKSLASNSEHTAKYRTRYELVKMSFEMVDDFDKYANNGER